MADDKHKSARYDELTDPDNPERLTHEEIMENPSVLESPLQAQRAVAPKNPNEAVKARARDERPWYERADDLFGQFQDATGIGAAMEGINKHITFGAWPALQRAWGENPDAYSEKSPLARSVGEGIGIGATILPSGGTSAAPTAAAAAPNALVRLGQALSRPAQAVEQSVAGALAKRLPAEAIPATRALLPGMASGAVVGGATDGVEGAMGGMIGAPIGQAVTKPAAAISKAIRDPRRMTGEYIQAMEQGAEGLARVKADKNIKFGGRGVRQVAGQEGERLGSIQHDRGAAANQAIEQSEAAIPELHELQPIAQVHRDLNATIDRYTNLRPVDEAHAKMIDEIKENLRNVTRQRLKPVLESDLQTNVRPSWDPAKRGSENATPIQPQGWDKDTFGPYNKQDYYDWPANNARKDAPGYEQDRSVPAGFEPDPARPGDELVAYAPGEQVSTAAATPMDLLKQRRALRKKADFGQAQTPENAAAREAYHALNEVLHNQKTPWAKQIRQMDEAYRGEMEALERGNELIYGKADGRYPTDTLSARQRAGGKLGQAMKDTQTGGDAIETLDRLRNMGSQYADPVNTVAATAAHRATRFGFNPAFVAHPGKWGSAGLIQNLDAAQVQLAEPFTDAVGGAGQRTGMGMGILRNPIDALEERKRRRKEKR